MSNTIFRLTDKLDILTSDDELIINADQSHLRLRDQTAISEYTLKYGGFIDKKKPSPDTKKRANPVYTRQMDFVFIDALNNEQFEDSWDEEVRYNSIRKKKTDLQNEGEKEVYIRNQQVSRDALRKAKNKCEFENSHGSFLRKTAPGVKYMEPHHLIPLSAYDDFDFSLDVIENVCSLCSTCHNCVHYGTIEARDEILNKLYSERRELLTAMGLEVSYEKLKSYY